MHRFKGTLNAIRMAGGMDCRGSVPGRFGSVRSAAFLTTFITS